MRWRVVCLVLIAAFVTGCLPAAPKQVTFGDAIASGALDYALNKIGTPYILGGQGPDVFDCSGLIISAYQQAYPALKLRIRSDTVDDARISELWQYNVELVPAEDARRGDLVFVTDTPNAVTHGGLFVRWIDSNNIEFVNASSFYGAVVVDTWPLVGTKREQWLVGIGRMKTVL